MFSNHNSCNPSTSALFLSQLDVVSYNALLSSAAASAAWHGALEVMQRMATEDQVGMARMDGDSGCDLFISV